MTLDIKGLLVLMTLMWFFSNPEIVLLEFNNTNERQVKESITTALEKHGYELASTPYNDLSLKRTIMKISVKSIDKNDRQQLFNYLEASLNPGYDRSLTTDLNSLLNYSVNNDYYFKSLKSKLRYKEARREIVQDFYDKKSFSYVKQSEYTTDDEEAFAGYFKEFKNEETKSICFKIKETENSSYQAKINKNNLVDENIAGDKHILADLAVIPNIKLTVKKAKDK
jgi:hypothetical protein